MNTHISLISKGALLAQFFITSLLYSNTYTVTSINDVGAGSLRQAIVDANNNIGADTISFNIPGIAPHTIQPTSATLPVITNNNTVIDGTTQPANGFTGVSPKIILDGSSLTFGYGLKITGSFCEVYGFYITKFKNSGISLDVAHNFVLGAINKGNVINNNSYGQILITGTNGGTIRSNKIGTDVTGMTTGLSTSVYGYDGLKAYSTNDIVIGGSLPGEENIISGLSDGINFKNCNNIIIMSNNIGTGTDGVTAIPNSGFGIYLSNSTNNKIENNIIAYNMMYGIRGNEVQYTKVTRNSIFCNSYPYEGLVLSNWGQQYAKPIITNITSGVISGTSQPYDTIEIYIDDSCSLSLCQGKTYISSVTATSSGTWSYTGNLSGSITATATNNSNTSSFSTCKTVVVSQSCNPVKIPNTAQIVKTSKIFNMGREIIWACENTTVTDNGGADTIFLEKNCTLYSNGGGAVIYAKAGSKLILNGGSEKIFYESTVTINDIAASATKTLCSSITYDYSKAPSGGCSITGIASENNNFQNISIYPNPSTGKFQITIDNTQFTSHNVEMEIYNVMGEKVYQSPIQQPGNSIIDISNQANGIYFLTVKTEKESLIQKLIISR